MVDNVSSLPDTIEVTKVAEMNYIFLIWWVVAYALAFVYFFLYENNIAVRVAKDIGLDSTIGLYNKTYKYISKINLCTYMLYRWCIVLVLIAYKVVRSSVYFRELKGVYPNPVTSLEYDYNDILAALSAHIIIFLILVIPAIYSIYLLIKYLSIKYDKLDTGLWAGKSVNDMPAKFHLKAHVYLSCLFYFWCAVLWLATHEDSIIFFFKDIVRSTFF